MARHTSRLGLVTMVASAVRTALRPGSAGLVERLRAVPRMLRSYARGEYRGMTLGHLALLVAALGYLVSPLDLVPEAFLGVFGIADDAVVVTWLVAALVADTEAYLDWERARGSGGRSEARGAGPQDARAEQWSVVRPQALAG